MRIVTQFLLLIVGFVMLIKGADWFVEGSSAVARRFGIPQLIVGLTIVALGTSLPEAAISISAALKGSAGIAVGNVLGSNILNVLLILGVSAMILPISVQRSVTRREIPFLLMVSLLLPLLGLIDGELGRIDALILLLIFGGYLFWLFKSAKKAPAESESRQSAAMPMGKAALIILTGALLVVLGSNITVDAAVEIARFFGMNDRLIGLTIIALGTSLPELVTSCIAAKKGNSDIALGNVVGSNLFNILFVLGSSALITPIAYPRTFLSDSIICVATCVLLLSLLIRDAKLQRSNGAIMLLGFIAYNVWLFLM